MPVLTARFVKAAKQKRGFTAWIERIGAITVGDTVTVVVPPQQAWPGVNTFANITPIQRQHGVYVILMHGTV
jgi:predicted aconitase